MYIDKIQSFVFDEVEGVDAAWETLRQYRRKLISVNPNIRHTYPNVGLLMLLMKKLPESYQTTVDGLHLHDNLSVEEKVMHLVEKEERSKVERANIASRRQREKRIPRRYDSDVSMIDVSDDQISPSKICYLCKGNHFQRHCPFIVEIQNFGERLRKSHHKKKLNSAKHQPKLSDVEDTRKFIRKNSRKKPKKRQHGY